MNNDPNVTYWQEKAKEEKRRADANLRTASERAQQIEDLKRQLHNAEQSSRSYYEELVNAQLAFDPPLMESESVADAVGELQAKCNQLKLEQAADALIEAGKQNEKLEGEEMKPPKPKFQKGQLVTLTRYLPPVLSGSTVSILAVQRATREYRYQVASTEYTGSPVWAYEEDLALPLPLE